MDQADLISFGSKERHTSKPNYSTAANTCRLEDLSEVDLFSAFKYIPHKS